MLPAMADKLVTLLGLDANAKGFLTEFPTKGNSLGERTVPTDPLMYRLTKFCARTARPSKK
jgi:cyanate lyase